jgi:hypothetical protein
VFLLFITSVGAAENTTTIVLPSGYSNHDDPNLLCRDTVWSDVVIFFFGNYVAHAATVILLPGESPLGSALVIISALLFPSSGAHRGLRAISSCAVFGKTELQRAARAGALYVAVENSGSISSESAYSIWNLYLFLLIFIGSINALSTRIHGRIPNGCVLHTVPADAKFVDDPEPEREDFLQRLRSYVRINSSLLRREPSQLLATTT